MLDNKAKYKLIYTPTLIKNELCGFYTDISNSS